MPYAYPYLPPFETGQVAAVAPSRDHGFASYEPGTLPFLATHLFGSATRVLDICEDYLGRSIPWHFHHPRLELIPFVDWENAQAGYGFLETGYGQAPDGTLWPFALSFDVIAHEISHLVLYSVVGLPQDPEPAPAFGAFHEGVSDIIALIALLHFPKALKRIVAGSEGDLYRDNELNRFGELSSSAEIRNVVNRLTLDDVDDEADIHIRSLALSGALYDILVEAYAIALVALGVIDREDLAVLRQNDPELRQSLLVSHKVAAASRESDLCVGALATARDFLGYRLLLATDLVEPDDFALGDFAAALLAADRRLTGSAENQDWLRTSFAWRRIAVPRIAFEQRASHRGLRRYAHRRIAQLPEPYEYQHRCAVHGRRDAAAARPSLFP
jgi:hypothetical protein